MTIAAHLPPIDHGDEPSDDMRDQRVILDSISWEVYEALLDARGERSVPRMTYLDGTLELLSPGRPHETSKTRLARILEAWAIAMNVVLEGYGSWTIRKKKKKGGAEADECYVLGEHDPDELERPDLAIEVVYTSGGIQKLDVWRRLGVPEVWIWQKGRLTFHVLGEAGYTNVETSALLPRLDPQLIAECMAAPNQTDAVKLLHRRLAELPH